MKHCHRQRFSAASVTFIIGLPVLLYGLPPLLRAFAAALNFIGRI